MAATLITGMSAVGKSSVIRRLGSDGYRAVDLDCDEWSHLVPDDSEFADQGGDVGLDWRWRTEAVRQLLSSAGAEPLFVAGTSTQQAQLYPLLDHVALLTTPLSEARRRLAERTTNDYGKQPAELERELELRVAVEPRLRRSACLVVDTSQHGLPEVVELVLEHVRTGPHPGPSGTGPNRFQPHAPPRL